MSFIQLCNKARHDFTNEDGSLAKFIPNIEVIASSLCHINRYTGHAGMYSVAQHSIHVYQQAKFLRPDDYRFQLSALLHDATEAYLNDISAPLKALLPDYRKIETHYHSVIDKHFHIDTKDPDISHIDKRILATEARSFGLDLITEELEAKDITAYHFDINRDKIDDVYSAFMTVYYYLAEQCYG